MIPSSWNPKAHEAPFINAYNADKSTFEPCKEYKMERDLRFRIMKNDLNDFGFSTVDPKMDHDIKDYAKEQMVKSAQLQAKLDAVMEIFNNLLNSLSVDPDKDIHWPDRGAKIAEIKDKLKNLTS